MKKLMARGHRWLYRGSALQWILITLGVDSLLDGYPWVGAFTLAMATVGVLLDRKGACALCRRRYGDKYGFPDLNVPDWAWKRISPRAGRHWKGGLLCPSCICEQLTARGFTDVPFAFKSGPLREGVLPAPVRLTLPVGEVINPDWVEFAYAGRVLWSGRLERPTARAGYDDQTIEDLRG